MITFVKYNISKYFLFIATKTHLQLTIKLKKISNSLLLLFLIGLPVCDPLAEPYRTIQPSHRVIFNFALVAHLDKNFVEFRQYAMISCGEKVVDRVQIEPC